mmetsp:Transcript_38072/g.151142  ORF Transcript_38072/g.151142 Transcript_38072/m.151142 type:complete len:109 (-) Transcript_38072:797-1123(-)
MNSFGGLVGKPSATRQLARRYLASVVNWDRHWDQSRPSVVKLRAAALVDASIGDSRVLADYYIKQLVGEHESPSIAMTAKTAYKEATVKGYGMKKWHEVKQVREAEPC